MKRTIPLRRAFTRAAAGALMLAFLAGCGGNDAVRAVGADADASLGQQKMILAVATTDGSALSTTTAAAPVLAWSGEPGGVAVATDAAENVYTARWDYAPAGDIFVAKRNVDGLLLWQVGYDNTDSTRHEVATWVDTDSQGNVLVSGTIRSGYSYPVNAASVLMKFAPDGRLLWRRVYEGLFDGSSTRKLVLDAADNVYVLGIGMSPSGQRITVRKFAPDGSTAWAWFDPLGIGAPINFKWSADGALVISARALSGSVNGYAKIDTAGRTLWTLPGIYSLTAGDAAGDAAGNSYLINGNYAAGSGSLLRKIGPDAALVWERPHPMTGTRIELARDGAAVVAGYPNAAGYGAAFMKFDPAGVLQWTNLDADGAGLALLAHAQLKLDALDNAYLAGSTMSQMAVTKVYSTGGSAWTLAMPYGYAQAMAFGQNGRLFVTGGTTARIDQESTGAVLPPPPAPLPPPPAPLPPPPPPPPPVVNADLMLTLTDSADPVVIGARLSYTATVFNKGPATATGVNFSTTLPKGVSLVGITASQGKCTGTATIGCSLGALSVSTQARVVITVKPQARGTLSLTGIVIAIEPDPVTADNKATQTTTVLRR